MSFSHSSDIILRSRQILVNNFTYSHPWQLG